jgi:hypothetical protein
MSENNVIVIPMMFDHETFKLLNDTAIKRGKTAATLVTEALREKIAKIEEEERKPK